MRDRNTTLWLLQMLGFVINWEKSVLDPSQEMEYLGFVIDSPHLSLSLPASKVAKIRQECVKMLGAVTVSVRELASLIGKLTVSIMAILPAPLHYRKLQMLKTKGLLKHQSYEAQVCLDPSSREELRWWIANLEHWNGKTFLAASPDLVICCDASLKGWGAVCGSAGTQGLWSEVESTWHINALELQAANFAVRSFTKNQERLHVHLRIDNSTIVAYINKMGGTRSGRLVDLTKNLFDDALSRRITVTAEHLAGVENTEADHESRVYKDWSNWRLNPRLFHALSQVWGPFEIDLFADRLNCQVDRFVSWKPDPAAEAVDTFQVKWSQLKGYVFPPFAMLGRCLAKVVQDQATLVVITPTWHTQDMLMSPQQERHPLVLNGTLSLAAWKIFGDERQQQAFQRTLPLWLSEHGAEVRRLLTIAPGQSGLAGVVNGRLIRLMPLWQM